MRDVLSACCMETLTSTRCFNHFSSAWPSVGLGLLQDTFSSHRDEKRNQWKQAHGRCHCWKRLATIDQTHELLRIAKTYGGEAPLQQYAPRGELLLNLHMHFHLFFHMYSSLQLHLQHVPGRGCHPVRGETSQGLRTSATAQESHRSISPSSKYFSVTQMYVFQTQICQRLKIPAKPALFWWCLNMSRQVQCVYQRINFALEGNIVGIRNIKEEHFSSSISPVWSKTSAFRSTVFLIIGVLCRKVFGEKNKRFPP